MNREIINTRIEILKKEMKLLKLNKEKNGLAVGYQMAQAVKEYIEKTNSRDAIVLCSAATLSNYIIYEAFKVNPNNTYLDIGSCLNPLLGLEGWKYTRGYLTGYWLNSGSPYQNQVDVWGKNTNAKK